MSRDIKQSKSKNLQQVSRQNRTYKNIKEYLFDLTPAYKIQNNLSYQDVLDKSEIFDFISTYENSSLPKINDKEEFITEYNKFSNYLMPYQYNSEDKSIKCRDIGLSYVSKSIMSINVFHFKKVFRYCSKEFRFYCLNFLAKEFRRANNSKHFYYHLMETPLMIQPMFDDDLSTEDNISYKREYRLSLGMKKLYLYLEKEKFPYEHNYKLSEFSKEELELYQLMEELSSFNNNVLIDFIDLEDIRSCLSDENEAVYYPDEVLLGDILDEFYEAYYVLTSYNPNGSGSEFLYHYVEYINSLENEALFYFNLINRGAIYKKDKAIIEHKESRNKIVERMNNVELLNDKMESYYERLRRNYTKS